MKIIVAGALGHIGSQLIRVLPEYFSNLDIIVIDDFSTQRYCSYFNLPKNAKFTLLEKKVQDCDLDIVLENVDVLIHLAATTDAAGTANNPNLIFNNNLVATKKIAQACLKNHVPLIFPSSTSVYGSQDCLVDEDCTELKPQSPYAECKIQEEQILQDYAKQGLQVAICRFGTIYGISPGMRFHTAVNKFCWQAVMGQQLTVWETAIDQKRPYLSLQDAVSAIIWIIKNKLYGNGLYNIVSGNHTVREVINSIEKTIPKIQIEFVKNKIMNQLSYEVCNKKIMNTGFKFNGNINQEIVETLKLLSNQLG